MHPTNNRPPLFSAPLVPPPGQRAAPDPKIAATAQQALYNLHSLPPANRRPTLPPLAQPPRVLVGKDAPNNLPLPALRMPAPASPMPAALIPQRPHQFSRAPLPPFPRNSKYAADSAGKFSANSKFAADEVPPLNARSSLSPFHTTFLHRRTER